MRAYINSVFLVCLISLASVGFAEEAVSSPGDTNEVSVSSFPYIAEITDDNVNIRSGPGTNYYSCGKLNKVDLVKVVAHKFSWSHIVPPPGSFSWISKRYVSVEPADPTVGVVTGDAVRVYAGSPDRSPLRSETVQMKLDKGDKVALLGAELEDYYKIAPPANAYLWVSTRYTKPVGEVEAVVEPETTAAVIPATEPEPEAQVEPSPTVVVPTTISDESDKLKEYYALAKQVEAELAKAVEEQNYTEIKKKLSEIAGNEQAGKAARYCEFALKQIERYELVRDVDKVVRLQNTQLNQIKARIDKARTARLARFQDVGRFSAVGKFAASQIYGPEAELKHYRLIDDAGRMICYALPGDSVSSMGLEKLIGRRVGLVGTIEPYPQAATALVRFTEIAEIR